MGHRLAPTLHAYAPAAGAAHAIRTAWTARYERHGAILSLHISAARRSALPGAKTRIAEPACHPLRPHYRPAHRAARRTALWSGVPGSGIPAAAEHKLAAAVEQQHPVAPRPGRRRHLAPAWCHGRRPAATHSGREQQRPARLIRRPDDPLWPSHGRSGASGSACPTCSAAAERDPSTAVGSPAGRASRIGRRRVGVTHRPARGTDVAALRA